VPPPAPPESGPAAGGEVVAGFAWTSLGRLLLQASNLVALTVTSRYITPAEFGLFAPPVIMASVAYAVADGTFGTALLQRKDLEGDHVRSAFWASLFAALAATAALILGAPFIQSAFGFEGLAAVVAVSALMVLPRLVAAVPQALLQRQMRFRELTTITLVTSLVGKLLPTVALAVAGFGVWALVAGLVVQMYMETALLFWRAKPTLAWPTDWSRARDVVGFGGRVMGIQSLNQVASNVDNVLVGGMLGAAALGFYSRVFALMMLPVNLIGSSAQQVLFPRFARLQDDRAALRAQFCASLDLVTGLVLPMSALLVIASDSLVLILLGSSWTPIITPTRVLFGAVMFRIGFKVIDTLSIATGCLMPTLWRQAVYAGLVAVGTLVGSRWGLTGVAAGVAAALFAVYLSGLWSASRLLGTHASELAVLHARGLAVTALAAGPAALLSSLAGEDFRSRLAADAAAGICFCAAMAFVMFLGPRALGGTSADLLRAQASRLLHRARANWAGFGSVVQEEKGLP
jgi:O-antigen/teichoic acid export membrane protein